MEDWNPEKLDKAEMARRRLIAEAERLMLEQQCWELYMAYAASMEAHDRLMNTVHFYDDLLGDAAEDEPP